MGLHYRPSIVEIKLMKDLMQFLILHGYTVIFLWVLAEQIGAPVPVGPLLLAAGALAGKGLLNFTLLVVYLVSRFIWGRKEKISLG